MQKKSLRKTDDTNKKEVVTKDDLDNAVVELRGEMKQMTINLRSEWKIDIDFAIKEAKDEILLQMKDMESRLMEVLADFMGEMRKSEENRVVTAYQVSEVNDRLDIHEERILKLEQKITVN